MLHFLKCEENVNYNADQFYGKLSHVIKALIKLDKSSKEVKANGNAVLRVDDAGFTIGQSALFFEYYRKFSKYFSELEVKQQLVLYYNKALQSKQKGLDEIRRNQKEQEERKKMMHKGKMNAFLAIENGSLEIEKDLEDSIRSKKQKINHDDLEENGKFEGNSYFLFVTTFNYFLHHFFSHKVCFCVFWRKLV